MYAKRNKTHCSVYYYRRPGIGIYLYDLQSFQKQGLFQEKTRVRHYILKGHNISQHSDKNNIQCHY